MPATDERYATFFIGNDDDIGLEGNLSAKEHHPMQSMQPSSHQHRPIQQQDHCSSSSLASVTDIVEPLPFLVDVNRFPVPPTYVRIPSEREKNVLDGVYGLVPARRETTFTIDETSMWDIVRNDLNGGRMERRDVQGTGRPERNGWKVGWKVKFRRLFCLK